jgi:hypothetical protein
MKILTTSRRAGRVLSALVMNRPGQTGVYFGESGKPMRGSPRLHDPKFQDRVVAETRAFLSAPSSSIVRIVPATIAGA